MIYNSVTELIGKTPMVLLSKYAQQHNVNANLIAKVEFFNPGGSVKDRVALAMIEDAERRGILTAGGTIIEPTSGNTGVGLSLVGAIRGYHVILTMPETMSIERRKLAAAYGTEIVLTPGATGMKGAIAKAEELRDSIPGAVILQQFNNPSTPEIHAKTTGKEIVADAKESGIQVDAFIAGVGTGGTVSGSAKAIKEAFPCKKVGMSVFGLEVAHAHIHLMPMDTEGDMDFRREKLSLPANEMEEIANKIFTAFQNL